MGVIGNVKLSKECLNFDSLEDVVREALLQDTWCNVCSKPDLEICNPVLYLENGRKFVEGKCTVCGNVCISEIFERVIDENENPNSL